MQRIRAGLTGLACVFLIVLLAAAFLNVAQDDPAASPGNAAGRPAAEPPRDPLAELGVAPDAAPEPAAPTKAAPPAP